MIPQTITLLWQPQNDATQATVEGQATPGLDHHPSHRLIQSIDYQAERRWRWACDDPSVLIAI